MPPKEVSEAIETLREAAAAAEPPKKAGHKAMPKPVNQLLPGFACAVMREAEEDKAVLKHAVDAAMSFLEPFTTRANLLVRIKDQWERARSGVAAADKVLREEIAKRTQGGPSMPHTGYAGSLRLPSPEYSSSFMMCMPRDMVLSASQQVVRGFVHCSPEAGCGANGS